MTDMRQARIEDAQALSTLASRVFTEKFGHLYKPEDLSVFLETTRSPERFAHRIADDAQIHLIAEEDGAMLGYAQACPLVFPVSGAPEGAMEIDALYVDAAAQGRGVGAALMEECLNRPALAEAPAIYLSVWSENFGAQRFYERFGFQKIGEHEFSVGEQRDLDFIYGRLR